MRTSSYISKKPLLISLLASCTRIASPTQNQKKTRALKGQFVPRNGMKIQFHPCVIYRVCNLKHIAPLLTCFLFSPSFFHQPKLTFIVRRFIIRSMMLLLLQSSVSFDVSRCKFIYALLKKRLAWFREEWLAVKKLMKVMQNSSERAAISPATLDPLFFWHLVQSCLGLAKLFWHEGIPTIKRRITNYCRLSTICFPYK